VNVSTDSSVVLLWNSPSGKLVQIEHALTAVGSGQTSLGIKGNWICLSPFI
jgi:20S proteasome alpha/beta subunit